MTLNRSQGQEIITLQFGNYSNHVGAHFWNFQDELCGRLSREAYPVSDIPDNSVSEVFNFTRLYREMSKHGEVQYYPRNIVFDLRYYSWLIA